MSETAVPGLSRGWRRAGAALALLGLVGCSSGTPTGPEAGAALVGPTWRVTTVAGQLILAGTTLTAEFSGEDRVAGSAGCNSYFALVKTGGTPGEIRVGPAGSTRMMSPDAEMAVEQRVFAQLAGVTQMRFVAGQLALPYTKRDKSFGVMLFCSVSPKRPASPH